MAEAAHIRAKRLLAILHLFEPDTEIPLDQVAEALGATVDDVTHDLELLSCCGVSGYTDELVPIYVDEGMLVVWNRLPALNNAIRLSGPEARALVSAMQAAGLGDQDELLATLMEAAAATSVDADDIRRLLHTSAQSGQADTLRQAALALEERTVLRLRYQTAGAEEPVERFVEPLSLVNERGAWYLEGFCRKAGALRTFRIDRVAEAEATAETYVPRELALNGRALATEDLPVALIRLAPGEEFSDREWPGGKVVTTHPDGSVDVELPYAGLGWISRQVVARLGGAEVIEPAEVREAVASLARSLAG